MLSILPWALMALAPLAEARFGPRPRSADDDSLRCCPCVPTSLNPQETTVTITATNSKETVTIDHTIVVPATTVFVTQTLTPSSPATVTQEVTVHPELPAKIETALVTSPSPEPSAQTVTMTVQEGGDQLESPKTVTVTINPDEPTTSVSATATSAVTITVTQQTPDHSSAEPSHSSNSQGVDANTVTVTNSQASQTEGSEPSIKTVTVVQKPPSPTAETVTFVENPADPSTTTVTLANSPSKAISANSTVETVTFVESPTASSTAATASDSNASNSTTETVTFVENSASPSTATVTLTNNPAKQTSTTATLASNSSNSTAETVTVVEHPASASTATVTLSSSSSELTTSNTTTETVPFVQNLPTPTATPLVVPPKSSSSLGTGVQTATSVAKPAMITGPPQAGTISPIVDQFTTMTQTVTSSGGDVNIEINIINIFTGEVICKKEGSDEPCDPKPSPCLTTGIFTQTATAFNTVIVTVSDGMWTNGTSATGVAPPLGTGTGSPVLRRGRLPMIRKRL
ncbi:hypothetical protein TsFJ059_006651 [Trichoderma semiorbis]|uniref:Uncharacterized protein n=1 Tax=Trichoderma semiorbis TaxID=1491008 RepID=A0A9P8KQS7_9HYPO|nr:hypothetical protein TsFJ059_006651 [Trichoderma semiorbis]